MAELIPIVKRNEVNRCWFCGSNKSVKYTGKILNPSLIANNRFIDILICNKCYALHTHDLVDSQIEKYK